MLNLLKAKWALQSLTDQPNVGELFNNGKLPFLQFDTDDMRVTGNSGCNSLTGAFKLLGGGKIDLGQMAMTKMACPGNGEKVFMNALNQVTDFKVNNNVLSLLNGKQELMKLVKTE